MSCGPIAHLGSVLKHQFVWTSQILVSEQMDQQGRGWKGNWGIFQAFLWLVTGRDDRDWESRTIPHVKFQYIL